ncbi:MAG: ligase, partial [Chloroflexaceae bacterium]|nr:ligase [Chloroflexaceae bacterium]
SQLATGSAMLAGLDDLTNQPPRGALRWYTMTTPAVILGTGQKLTEFDRNAAQAAGIVLHRRSSGGTAVFADPLLLMQDIVLPTDHPLYTFDVTRSYYWLGALWVAVLARLGIAAHLIDVEAARTDTRDLDPLTRRSCYGGRSPYEVLVNGKKLVGLAQTRRRAGALLQTGIYTHWQAQPLADLLLLTTDERAALVERLNRRVVGLGDLLPNYHPADLLPALIEAFEQELHTQHGITLEDSTWNTTELATREREATGRYGPLG